MATDTRDHVVPSANIEVAQIEEKSADVLEQIDTLKGNYPDRKLLRSALLDLREHIRTAKERREEEQPQGELSQRAERLLERAEDFFQKIDEEKEDPVEVIEIGEHLTEGEVEEPPPKNWEDKFQKVELRAKKDKGKRKSQRHKARLAQEAVNCDDTSHERRVLLRLTVATVTAAIVFAAASMVLVVLTAKHGQPAGYAATGTSLALTGIMGLVATLSERSRRLLAAVAEMGKKREKAPVEE